MEIDDLIERVNRVAEQSSKIALKEWYKRTSRQTAEEARLPSSFRPPPPDGVDEAITSIIEIFRVADASSRNAIASRLNEYAQERCLAYSIRMAMLAVRSQSPILIERGLIALVIEGGKKDWRENVITLAMLYNSALKLGMDAQTTFADIARIADPGAIQREMNGFPLRQPKDRDLNAFYLLEEITEDGFVYKQTPWWMKFPQRDR